MDDEPKIIYTSTTPLDPRIESLIALPEPLPGNAYYEYAIADNVELDDFQKQMVAIYWQQMNKRSKGANG